MDRDKMSNLYRRPSMDASYQVSIHLAKQDLPVVNIQEAVVKALELAAQVLGLIQELEPVPEH
jgi:hypothetical protein